MVGHPHLFHGLAYLANIMLNKEYPYEVITKSEGLPSLVEGDKQKIETEEKTYYTNPYEFAGYNGPNTTYMTEDFALGTAYSQFHDGGLTESFYTVYRKIKQAGDLADTGVVFSRYIINDKVPEKEQFYNVYGNVGKEAFRDEGRKFGIQSKDCAMMLYKPKQFEAHHMFSMKLSLLFSCHFKSIDEIYLGEKNLNNLTGEAEEPETIFIKDGPVYMAFKPLVLTNHGREKAVKVERTGNYLIVSFFNYEGPGRSFSEKEVFLTANGFIAHIKSADNCKSFAEFRALPLLIVL